MKKDQLIELKKQLEAARDEKIRVKKTTWFRPVEVSETDITPECISLYSIEEDCDTVGALTNFEKMMEFYIKTLVDNGIAFDKISITLPFTVFVDKNSYDAAIEEDNERDFLNEYYFPKNVPILDEYVGVHFMDLSVYNQGKQQTIYGISRTLEYEFKKEYMSMHIVKYSDFMNGLRELGYNFSEIGDFNDLKMSLYDSRIACCSDIIEFSSKKPKTIKKD